MWLSAPEAKITRTFFARGLKCGRRDSSASNESNAMPLRPVPPKRRKSRRFSIQRPAFESRLEYINELVGVEQRATKKHQALLANESIGGGEFGRTWCALEGELECKVGRGVPAEPLREQLRLLHHEPAIEKIER